MPIDGLVDDILRVLFHHCIFDRCCPIPGQKRGWIAVDHDYHTSTPIILSQVCSRWRRIAAYNTPSLWARICINLFETPCLDLFKVEMVVLWLQRSQPLPLSIDVSDSDWKEGGIPSTEGVSPVLGIMKAMIAHSVRWKYVRLRLITNSFVTQWWKGLHTPILEACQINDHFVRCTTPNTMCLTNSESVLSDLCTSHRAQHFSSGHLWNLIGWVPDLPWEKVVTIKLGHVEEALSSKKVLDMLFAGRSSIEQCTIPHVRDWVDLEDLPTVKAPKLKVLAIEAVAVAPALLDRLILPSLTSLTVIIYNYCPMETDKAWRSVAELGARSRGRDLTRLRILGREHFTSPSPVPESPDHGIILHPTFSHISHLAVKSISNEMLVALTWFKDDQASGDIPPLPFLSVLHLTGFKADGDVLFDMVASRVRGVPNPVLRRVHLTDQRPEVEEIRQELQARLPEIVTECPWQDEWIHEVQCAYPFPYD
ncbi:hypothetical protein BKA70DRAFT_853264 [Coprinopsis sp. MPI-PUGE-AT-0042]|nr:hypothetical protein BKA70DRAFT_853264 [Coprinopsis sp. MPI-PUGE-AT-0042]